MILHLHDFTTRLGDGGGEYFSKERYEWKGRADGSTNESSALNPLEGSNISAFEKGV